MAMSAKALKTLCEGYSLLYVEDDHLVREEVERTLRRLFHDVYLARDGVEGLAAFMEHQPDIVITDIGMPRKNGLDMAREIKAIRSNTPIIITTAFSDERFFIQAIELGIDAFLLKPIDKQKVYEAIQRVVTLLSAQKKLEKERKEHVGLLSEKVAYSNYHEKLSFEKELQMIRNDFYYRLVSTDGKSQMVLADFLYRSKDLLSGDSYSARRLGDGKALFIVVDGMGKGLSASISAMMSMAYINHTLDTMVTSEQGFTLEVLVKSVLVYLQSILLEEEILSAIFVMIDPLKHIIDYASFSMPPPLLMYEDGTIERLKSNNLPINSYANTSRITRLSYTHLKKILIYSDGISENSLKHEEGTYAKHIANDFKQAISREDLVERMSERMGEVEDDMTFIFLHLIRCELLEAYCLPTTLRDVEKAELWYSALHENIIHNTVLNTKSVLAFSELVMNAYEHGNLGIDKEEKHRLLENETYFDFLTNIEKACHKKIDIKLFITSNEEGQRYLLTWIEDEGDGFDTALLSTTFGVKRQFNGRGVFISKRSSLGIYYNTKGNGVLFITKV